MIVYNIGMEKRKLADNQFLVAAGVLLFLWFLFQIRSILIVLFIAYIIKAALYPFVLFLKKRNVPNVLSVAFVYIAFIGFIIVVVFPLIPFFVSQIESFIKVFPSYFESASKFFNIHIEIENVTSYITSQMANIGKNAVSVTTKIFSSLFSVLTVIAVSFYLLLDQERIQRNSIRIFSQSIQKKAEEFFIKAEEKLGAWFRGQIVLSISIGVMTWIVLTLLHIPFAVPLAIMAGILEILPTIGPILSSIPAIIIGFTISPFLALLVAISYSGIQILENNILVPRIMEKAVGLHPVVVIVVILIGAELMGVIGALLAVPFTSLLVILYSVFQKKD